MSTFQTVFEQFVDQQLAADARARTRLELTEKLLADDDECVITHVKPARKRHRYHEQISIADKINELADKYLRIAQSAADSASRQYAEIAAADTRRKPKRRTLNRHVTASCTTHRT